MSSESKEYVDTRPCLICEKPVPRCQLPNHIRDEHSTGGEQDSD